MNRMPLPIDSHLGDLVAAIRRHPVVVLEAPPGTGKTTRLPPTLLEAVTGKVVVTQPRRIAARLAAKRAAEERHEAPGVTIGWRVRHENRTSSATRLTYETEGTFLQELRASPRLDGVDVVLIDEFHERHLDTDLVLGHLLALRRGERPDLRIVVMSATMDAEGIAATLPGAVFRRIETPVFPVAVEFAAPGESRPLEQRVASAVRRLLDEEDGDILVFLPGIREILQCERALASMADTFGVHVVTLYGSMAPDLQDLAVRPHHERRMVLSTNVAESSVTLPAVTAVVDSGLAREAGFDPWSGLPRLDIRPISQASAVQRTGRAGRLRPGRCIRLYSEHDFRTRPQRTSPEVLRVDLAGALLDLRCAGLDPAVFDWLTPPPEAALIAATRLLQDLGAVAADGQPTVRGRRMVRLPLHPRLARLAIEGAERGVGQAAVLLAAALSERSPRSLLDGGPPGREDSPSDALDLIERLQHRRVDAATMVSVDRTQRQLAGMLGLPADDTGREADLLRSILAGYPDRLARRREPGGEVWVAARGGVLRQSPRSRVRRAGLAVMMDAERRDGATDATAQVLSAVDEDWLWELEPSLLTEEVECVWDDGGGRVFVIERRLWDRLVLEERRRPPGSAEAEAAGRLLARQTLVRGTAAFFGADALAAWRGRLAFAAPFLGIGDLPLDDYTLEQRVAEACAGHRALRELPAPAQLLADLVGPALRGLLDRVAPRELRLPGGRKVAVHYTEGQPPWIETMLQDCFGMNHTPTIAEGRVPLVVHLLGPNRRAVQVTSDLAGFWREHYPTLRRELARRYPRHAWPENPLAASPPQRRR